MTNLKFLPLCLYVQLRELLYFMADKRRGYETNLDLRQEIPEATRQDARGDFKIPKSQLQKTDDNCFSGTKSL